MSPDPAPDPLIGRTVADGRYEILSRLGQGGTGAVYRARQHPLDRLVALKLIQRELSLEPGAMARFWREMKVTSAIEHPHTVRVYDYGTLDGHPFLAMEYLEGMTLRGLLDREGCLPPARIVAIALQITKALRAAHEAGVVHRDLKPDNVMLLDRYGDADFVKVLDFGIARPLHDRSAFRTNTGLIIGTPAYMSPEQASGTELDGRSDLYALGVILYELVSGAPPFEADSVTALLVRHLTAPVPALASSVYPVPLALEQLTRRLLAKSADERPQSAALLLAELQQLATYQAAAMTTEPLRDARAKGASDPAPNAQGASAVAGAAGGTLPMPNRPANATPSTPGGAITSRREAAARGTLSVPIGPPPSSEGPAPSGASATPSSAAAKLWLFGLLALVLIGAGVVALVILPKDYEARPPGIPKPPTLPAPSQPRADGQPPALPLLQVAGEPAFPASCRTHDGQVAKYLQDAASRLPIEGEASSIQREQALFALQRVPEFAAERWLLEARLLASGDPEVALPLAERAAVQCPDSAVARNLLGNALQKRKRASEAEAAYKEALRLAPDYLAPRFNLGSLQLKSDRAAEALETFEQIAKTAPDHPNLLLVRADAQRRLGRHAAALADLEEHTKRHPESADGWLYLGQALRDTDPARAVEAFCRARDLGAAEASSDCPKGR